RVDERLAIGGAIRDGDGNSPAPLAGDAPVRTVLHHPADAILAPGGNPPSRGGDLVDGLERGLADGRLAPAGKIDFAVERDPPLVGGAEDDRLLAAPAMRIAVADLERLPAVVEERACAAQLVDDLRVGVEDL